MESQQSQEKPMKTASQEHAAITRAKPKETHEFVADVLWNGFVTKRCRKCRRTASQHESKP